MLFYIISGIDLDPGPTGLNPWIILHGGVQIGTAASGKDSGYPQGCGQNSCGHNYP